MRLQLELSTHAKNRAANSLSYIYQLVDSSDNGIDPFHVQCYRVCESEGLHPYYVSQDGTVCCAVGYMGTDYVFYEEDWRPRELYEKYYLQDSVETA